MNAARMIASSKRGHQQRAEHQRQRGQTEDLRHDHQHRRQHQRDLDRAVEHDRERVLRVAGCGELDARRRSPRRCRRWRRPRARRTPPRSRSSPWSARGRPRTSRRRTPQPDPRRRASRWPARSASAERCDRAAPSRVSLASRRRENGSDRANNVEQHDRDDHRERHLVLGRRGVHEVGNRRDRPCGHREQHQDHDGASPRRAELLGAVPEPADEERQAEHQQQVGQDRARPARP